MPDKSIRFRLDFKMEYVSSDEASNTIQVRLIPNPARYEWKEVNGRRALYDKLDKLIIPEEVLAKGMKNISGTPIRYQPQLIDDADGYVKSRLQNIRDELSGNFPEATFEDKSDDFLQSLEVDDLGFVILSFDLANSTILSTSVSSVDYKRLVTALLFEVGGVIPLFHGHVLKYTGDGIIAYFAEPSFITKNDLAIDCALTLNRLVYNGFNPVLASLNLPNIDIRIGLDSGNAYVVTIGNPSTKQHKDIIGSVVSLAAKIQSVAQPGEVTLGQVTLQNLHTNWRLRCKPVTLPANWKYLKADGSPYEVFLIEP